MDCPAQLLWLIISIPQLKLRSILLPDNILAGFVSNVLRRLFGKNGVSCSELLDNEIDRQSDEPRCDHSHNHSNNDELGIVAYWRHHIILHNLTVHVHDVHCGSGSNEAGKPR